VTGTFINVGAILAGTLIGTVLGGRMPEGLQRRVLAGLGLVVLVIGVDLALAWRDTSPLYVWAGSSWAAWWASCSASRTGWPRSATRSSAASRPRAAPPLP
jgi:hypothetical protein